MARLATGICPKNRGPRQRYQRPGASIRELLGSGSDRQVGIIRSPLASFNLKTRNFRLLTRRAIHTHTGPVARV